MDCIRRGALPISLMARLLPPQSAHDHNAKASNRTMFSMREHQGKKDKAAVGCYLLLLICPTVLREDAEFGRNRVNLKFVSN